MPGVATHMAPRLYVRAAGSGELWHIVRHPPQREDPVWSERPALCGATGTGTPWGRRSGWYEHEFSRGDPSAGPACPHCQERRAAH